MADHAHRTFFYLARCGHCVRAHHMVALRDDAPPPTACVCGCTQADGTPMPYISVELLDHEETCATLLARCRFLQARLDSVESTLGEVVARLNL